MTEKYIKSRIIHKHSVEANWLKATNFIPLQGEIIVYDKDSSHAYERIKVGDGTTNVNSLPFVNDALRIELLAEIESLTNGTTTVQEAVHATTADTANAVVWTNVTGKPSTYTPATHNHNDTYYTESEVDEQIDTLADSINPIVTTAGTGAAYTATVPGITTLTTGVSFIMIPHTVSTSTQPTLDVNGLGAKKILRRTSSVATGSQPGTSTSWLLANYPFRVIYDGTTWIVEGQPKPAASDISGTLSIDKGGTGATTAAAALTNLGVTATASELNYMEGVTSNVQTQITELSEEVSNIHTNVSNQIVSGSGNGWSYTIFPDNTIIMRKKATLSSVTSANDAYSNGVDYTTEMTDYFPDNIKIYDAAVSIAAEGGLTWDVNSGVLSGNNGIYFRLMKANSNHGVVNMNYFVYGSMVPVTYPTSPSTSGTAIADFKIWSNPSRNMKVTYTTERTSDTAATVELTYTYTMNGSSGYTAYAQSVTPTINGSAKSATTLKSTSDDDSWYGSPIVKTVSYSITGLSASTTAITLSCKFTSTDSADADVTKTGTINLGLYS